MNEPMLIDCETPERALELYRMWESDQTKLGLRGQLSLWVEPELAGRAFELSGF